jgi:hypothetical protein
MKLSAEVRFWWAGELPEAVRTWFAARDTPPGGGKERTDLYLLDRKSTEVGIKSRNGKRTEVKSLFDLGPAVLPAPFDARVEFWSKSASQALDLSGLPTARVVKRRRLRTFDMKGGLHEVAVGEDEAPLDGRQIESGCNAELTEITGDASAGTWWTAALEGFGPLPGLHRNLAAVAAAMPLPQSDPPSFMGSYPAWLAQLG